jgi:hypothetical protein
MKRYTHVALAILLLGFTGQSCKKDSNESFSRVEKFENLLSLPDPAQMKIAYSELAAPEKAEFWKYNLRKKMDGLTNPEKNLVKEMLVQLSPAAYENGSNENIKMKTLIVPNWLSRAENVFTKSKLWELFYFMEGGKTVEVSPLSYVLEQTEPGTEFYNESAPNCLCNIGSRYTCRKREISVGTNGAGIKDTYGSCSYSKNNGVCDRDDYGCGFMTWWPCNGNTCSF